MPKYSTRRQRPVTPTSSVSSKITKPLTFDRPGAPFVLVAPVPAPYEVETLVAREEAPPGGGAGSVSVSSAARRIASLYRGAVSQSGVSQAKTAHQRKSSANKPKSSKKGKPGTGGKPKSGKLKKHGKRDSILDIEERDFKIDELD
ncbi:hypothetical protein M408DRAFT_8654 [Serendipita vermifera MAFF 305830]|uniref:Uncharacterized protein n=1 Tax=Serendipita vermifera MAFF 305830 TaxID=933852 RepID=A0A0C2WQL7_SERVB|nr:hypothetical protein M408DRAFT_8654 [Serendipita vermifera MAFF 305830]